MDATVFDAKPLAFVYVVNLPWLSLLTPPFRVPAQTAEPRL